MFIKSVWGLHESYCSSPVQCQMRSLGPHIVLSVKQESNLSDSIIQILFVHFQTNSYEGLVITNRTESYAVFTYLCGALSWHGNATIGFNAGGTLYKNYPGSGSSSVHSIACTNYSRSVWTNVVYKLTPNGIKLLIL